eukprot:Clim_evm69s215 gene=Clim_evmTU69s215
MPLPLQCPSIKLRSGICMPMLGLGTFKVKDESDVETAVRAAVKHGYRRIDTAKVYRNESMIGKVLKEIQSPTDGRQIWITTKLGPKDQGYDQAIKAVEKSLTDLGVDCIDLILIHWPGSQGLQPDDSQHRIMRSQTWQALLDAKSRGLCRSVGVSNYTVRHLKELAEDLLAGESDPSLLPEINQVEYHPLFRQDELRAYCAEHGIAVEAYSVLGKGLFFPKSNGSWDLPADLTMAMAPKLSASLDQLATIAHDSNLAISDMLMRYVVAKGYPLCPKSVHESYIKANGRTITDECRAHPSRYVEYDRWPVAEDRIADPQATPEALSNAVIEALDAIELQYKIAWNPDVIR